MSVPVVIIRDLRVALPKGADRPFAVEDVTLEVAAGEILCVVGESGSGKSVLASAIMGALPRGLTLAGGSIRFKGEEVTTLPEAALRAMRGRDIAMIFQEPMASLRCWPSMRRRCRARRARRGWRR